MADRTLAGGREFVALLIAQIADAGDGAAPGRRPAPAAALERRGVGWVHAGHPAAALPRPTPAGAEAALPLREAIHEHLPAAADERRHEHGRRCDPLSDC